MKQTKLYLWNLTTLTFQKSKLNFEQGSELTENELLFITEGTSIASGDMGAAGGSKTSNSYRTGSASCCDNTCVCQPCTPEPTKPKPIAI